MSRLILFLFFIIGSTVTLFAQPLNRATAAVNLKTAQDQEDKQDHFRALEYYDKYFEETKDYDVYPQMARLSMKLRDYKKAERYYGRYLKDGEIEEDEEETEKNADDDLNTLEFALKKGKEAVSKGKSAIKKKGKGKKKKKKSKKAKARAKKKAQEAKQKERDEKAIAKGKVVSKKKRERKPLTPEQKEDRFEYGQALKANEKFEEAIAQFEKYISTGTDPIKRELAQNELEGAQYAMQLGVTKEDGESVNGLNITNVKKLNSKEAEYGPFLHKDELYYASFGDVKEIISTDGETPLAYAQIYKATKNKDSWGKGEALGTKINREDFQTTHPHISPDGETLYFTRSLMRGNKVEISTIYYSEKKGNEWAGPNEVVIGFDELDFKAYHPAVGDLFGKEVLFFVSDMDGGEGGKDIYYATKKGEGVYGEPVPLASVNTPGDEVTPFYRNGALYFSSNGLPGLGGFDIFTGANGFLTSNRSGRGFVASSSCFDIFAMEIPPITANVLATVFDGKKALRGATVAILEMEGTNGVNPKEQSNKKANNFDFPLQLEKTYMLIASKKGYTRDTVTLTTLDLKDNKTFSERFVLAKAEPVKAPEPEPAKPAEPAYEEIAIEINQPIRLSNIFYDFDDDKILLDAEKDLSVLLDLMQRYPDMVIELSSHTDYRGPNDYNEKLSQRRADSAKKWLTERGIEVERIKAVGYGEKLPATVDSITIEGTEKLQIGWVLDFNLVSKLTPKENREVAHQINRRTEFRIIAGPTNIKIKKLEKRLKKVAPKPKVINKTKKKKSKRRNANPVGDTLPKTGPKMVFDYAEVDFGVIKKGEKREHIFKFTNKGDEALVIEIVSACDCTTTEYPTEPVAPGEKGEIKAIFDSSAIEGTNKIDIDIILENEDPKTGYQIVERVSYFFQLEE